MTIPSPYDIKEVSTGKNEPKKWMVCYNGIQLGGNYDSSGAGNLTFSSYGEAFEYLHRFANRLSY